MEQVLATHITDTCRMTHGNEDAVDRVLAKVREALLSDFAAREGEGSGRTYTVSVTTEKH